MPAKSKRAKKTRVKGEFDVAKLLAETSPLIRSTGSLAWGPDDIRNARQSQMSGQFRTPARLAASVKTDGAIYAAMLNRIAPQRGLPVELCARNESAKGKRQRDEGDALFGPQGFALSPETIGDLNLQLVNHGVFFGVLKWTARADGSRLDVELKPWPIEFIYWMPSARQFVTQTRTGSLEYISHGDGTWVVGAQSFIEPWIDGAIVPLANIWMDRAYGIRDRAKASLSHGNAKMVGTMPDGVPLQNKDGSLTAEGLAFLTMLRTMHTELPIGVKPSGAELEMLVNNSTAWEIFRSIIDSGASDAAGVLLGSDGLTKSSGGNYIKDGWLFGVRNDIVEGDLNTLARAINTGVIDPWAAINFEDSDNAPRRRWLMPDADEDARRASVATRTEAFTKALAGFQDTQIFMLDQDFVDELAKRYDVKAPRVKASPQTGPSAVPQTPSTPAPTEKAPPLRAV